MFVCLLACLFVCLFVCLCFCLSVCLSVCLFVCLFVCRCSFTLDHSKPFPCISTGAFKNFLPQIDQQSITVKPFSDGIDVFSFTGQRSDVGPSEYAPGLMEFKTLSLDDCFKICWTFCM